MKSFIAVMCSTKTKPFLSSENVARKSWPSRTSTERVSCVPLVLRRMWFGPNVSSKSFSTLSMVYGMPACTCRSLMQGALEGAAGEDLARLGIRRDRRGDRRGDVVVDLVVLLAAEPRRKPDLEDEEFAGQRGRIEVVGKAGAVAHREAPKLGPAREQARDTPVELRFHWIQFLLTPLLQIYFSRGARQSFSRP